MGFMARYREVLKVFHGAQLVPWKNGALTGLELLKDEFVKVVQESTERKHRAERAEVALERQQNDNYNLNAQLERANDELAQTRHRLNCVLNVQMRYAPKGALVGDVCKRADHMADLRPHTEASLADKISAYAAHLEESNTHNNGVAERAALARDMAAIIFRAEEHAKRA